MKLKWFGVEKCSDVLSVLNLSCTTKRAGAKERNAIAHRLPRTNPAFELPIPPHKFRIVVYQSSSFSASKSQMRTSEGRAHTGDSFIGQAKFAPSISHNWSKPPTVIHRRAGAMVARSPPKTEAQGSSPWYVDVCECLFATCDNSIIIIFANWVNICGSISAIALQRGLVASSAATRKW